MGGARTGQGARARKGARDQDVRDLRRRREHLLRRRAAAALLGRHPSRERASLVELEASILSLNQMAADVPVGQPWTAPQAADWDAQSVGSWIADNNQTAEARNLLARRDPGRLRRGGDPDLAARSARRDRRGGWRRRDADRLRAEHAVRRGHPAVVDRARPPPRQAGAAARRPSTRSIGARAASWCTAATAPSAASGPS